MDEMSKNIDQLGQVLSGGNMNIALKIGLLSLAIVAAFFLVRWIAKAKIEVAREEEDQTKISDKQEIIRDNKVRNDEAQADSDAVDDFLKGGNK